jgi:type IV pilus assembly protein PilM
VSGSGAKTSVWKKEITLRRKPKEKGIRVPAAPEQLAKPDRKAGAETSVWKKEITFRGKPRERGVVPVPVAAEAPKSVSETSVWKKEITLRRKPKAKGRAVPAAPEEPAKPDSVAELLRPIADDLLEPVALPPITPPVSALPPVAPPVAPPVVAPPEPEPEAAEESVEPPPAELEPEPEPVAPATALPAATEILVPAEQVLPPPLDVPLPASAEPVEELPAEPEAPRPSRRERKAAEQEAERLAKEERRRAKEAAKQERRAEPTHKQLVGLKVGATHLAAAQVINKGDPRVVRMARMPLERGVVVGGELREPEELAAALKTFFRKNKLPKNAVRLGVANNRIGVRTFEISGIDDPKQLSNAIRFRAQETLPIPLDEAVLDYRILRERVDDAGVRTRRVLLVVAHRELVERYAAACRKAGLKLVGIDLEAFALLRALGDPGATPAAAEDAGLVCVSIGHDRSTLAVSNGSVCEFTRVLPWGGSALDVAVARVLDLTPSEAEPVKRELSLTEEGEAAGLDLRHAELARQAMEAELQVFARELVASLRFYQEQPGSLGIAEVLITGGGSELEGLAEELERLLGVAVKVADPLARVKLPRKLRKARTGSTGSLAVAVGLGIED